MPSSGWWPNTSARAERPVVTNGITPKSPATWPGSSSDTMQNLGLLAPEIALSLLGLGLMVTMVRWNYPPGESYTTGEILVTITLKRGTVL